jgi:hypothetical protein
MKRCLSTKALLRLYARDGTEEQRRHVDTCGACSRWYQRMSRELEAVKWVLLDTEEPVTAVAARTRLWVPVSAVATALIVLVLLWSNSAVRSPVRRAQQPMPAHEAAAVLEDVSLTMFSIEGRPAALVQEARLFGSPVTEESGCEGPDWFASAECDQRAHVDRLLNLFEPPDSDL